MTEEPLTIVPQAVPVQGLEQLVTVYVPDIEPFVQVRVCEFELHAVVGVADE